MSFLLGLALLVVFFSGYSFSWTFYNYFADIKDLDRTIGFDYLIKRFAFSIAFGIGLAALPYTYYGDNDHIQNANVGTEKFPQQTSGAGAREEMPKNAAPEVAIKQPFDQQTNPSQKSPQLIPDATKIDVTEPNPVNRVQSGPGFVLSKEKIEQMERDKQYTGDDPVVRARLGLPPRQ